MCFLGITKVIFVSHKHKEHNTNSKWARRVYSSVHKFRIEITEIILTKFCVEEPVPKCSHRPITIPALHKVQAEYFT
jgi:hypothetical protein